MDNKKIFVTQPYLPPIEDYMPYLKEIWDSKQLTNNGNFHKQLEGELAQHLGVDYISIFSNGTIALICALQALKISGEVITTPYSFAATAHALWWNNITPVFVDIDPRNFNLNPDKIEAAITDKTQAILPVHVYGNPCDDEKIQKIAQKHNLKVIYDAAHAFGVKKNGNSILNLGDLSVLSFHATKVFSTIEGGAIVCHSEQMKRHIDNLKNFGFRGETVIEEPGINGKMNEFQAAFGLMQLKDISRLIEKRKALDGYYRTLLSKVEGIVLNKISLSIQHNYSYFPILIDELTFGLTRDQIFNVLQSRNIYSRRYFYPLLSSFEPYKHLKSANINNLKVAENIAERVICLPLFPDLEFEDVDRIVKIIKEKS